MDDLPEIPVCKTSYEDSQLPKDKDTATTETTSSKPTISENVQKPTLITLPEEIIELIIKQLHPVPSMCLALTARKFNRIHKAVHGKVSLYTRHEDKRLSTLLVDWHEERGFTCIIFASQLGGLTHSYFVTAYSKPRFVSTNLTSEWFRRNLEGLENLKLWESNEYAYYLARAGRLYKRYYGDKWNDDGNVNVQLMWGECMITLYFKSDFATFY
ncbi:hypothetical protein HYFRA_00010104 [Hymenoscyphus fraxineus]|uniref:F-box domain-containing protein n=1 Tax=Hymenoscyphus fraxineus TaxID=746836 RepID=A0A9N9PRZ9_9HELO|nr:hypothetical protein HYFRA_00010104 [Hymenoscyphus fraxineus]